MDAFQLTRPVLSSATRTLVPGALLGRRGARSEMAPAVVEEALVAARRYAYQLPLGSAPMPLTGRDRWSFTGAARELSRALWRVATARGVAVDVDEPPVDLARRLARARALVPPAADAVAALLPVLEAGAAGEVDDTSLEPSAAKLAERIVGYLSAVT